jgi:hypothetical protein
MKLSFNKENWSGEKMEIDVDETNQSFKFYDYNIRLEKLHTSLDEEFNIESYQAFIDDELYPTVVVSRFDDELLGWNAYSKVVEYHRSDRNMYAAVAKVLANTL